MVSLGKIKGIVDKRISRGNNKETVEQVLHPLEIGFKVESGFDIRKRNFKKKLRILIDELRVGGFFTNFWMWNFFLLNLLASFLLFYTISNYIHKLPDALGISYDDDITFDLVISKNYLYVLPSLHIMLAVILLLIAIKSHRKLSHVFTIAFIYFGVLIFFELIGLRDLIFYFL